MRKIICRFRNNEDLEDFVSKNNISITKLTKEYNLNTLEHKEKSPTKKKVKQKYWETQWVNMPKFSADGNYEYCKVEFLMTDDYDINELSKIFDQNITNRTKSIWYPRLIQGQNRKYRCIGGDTHRYPIYVISKGRSHVKRMHTSFRLSEMKVKHYLVVEPQEYDDYFKNFNNEYATVLVMDMKYKEDYDVFSNTGGDNSCGPGAVRNFCWEHSIKNGDEWHWVMDDNLDGFHVFWDGKRVISQSEATFSVLEDFVDRYDNIAIAGINYTNFCRDGDVRPAFVLNTRIYSCLLIKNDIPYRWRGRYNEDTDLSLRALKDGYCTVQLNMFLNGKRCTQQLKGGNTEEFYAKEGTLNKSQMLKEMHPDVTEVVWKFNRWHHQVNYSVFKQELHLKNNIAYKDYSDIKIVEIPIEINATGLDDRDYIENNYIKVVDILY